MIYNISYKNAKIDQAIDTSVGQSYSLKERIKMGGNGHKRMIIKDWSSHFEKLLTYDQSTKSCSFEIRPKGLIVRFRSILDTYAWTLPFEKIRLDFSSEGTKISNDEEYITLKRDYDSTTEMDFFSKLLTLKNSAE